MTNPDTSSVAPTVAPVKQAIRTYTNLSGIIAQIVGYDGNNSGELKQLIREMVTNQLRYDRLNQQARDMGFPSANDALLEMAYRLPNLEFKGKMIDGHIMKEAAIPIPISNELESDAFIAAIEPAPVPAALIPRGTIVITKFKKVVNDNPRGLPLQCKSSRPLEPRRVYGKRT